MLDADIDQIEKAKSWCFKNHIKVVPVLAETSYQIRGARNKKIDLRHVRIVIDLNDAQHVGKEVYRQDQELTDKCNEIYLHYYERRNN